LTEKERAVERWEQRVGSDGNCWRNHRDSLASTTESDYWHNFAKVLPEGCKSDI